MGIEAWKQKWGSCKPKQVKHFEPLPHGGHILGEELAYRSTQEIKRIYSSELSQSSLDQRALGV
jgi:hypothetical protein